MKIYTIYKAICNKNQKVYIGFDSNFPSRINDHKKNSNTKHYKFYRAIRKYGWESFEWEIIYQSKDRDHTISIMEPYFIAEYDSFHKGYNMTTGGEGTFGIIASKELKEKRSNARKGKKHSEETKRKIRLSQIGKIISEETKQKISKNHHNVNKENNPFYGRKHSEETKQKIGNRKYDKGKNHPKSIQVNIDGIDYESMTQAQNQLNLTYHQIKKLVRGQSVNSL